MNATTPEARITMLLHRWQDGDQEALEELIPLVYRQLRLMARGYMQRERADHTFSTTDLVHEAYFKLFKKEKGQWNDRVHFFAVAAKAMRYILITYAHRRETQKRGGNDIQWIPMDLQELGSRPAKVLSDLDEAIDGLEKKDKQAARMIELHYFCGLTIDELAQSFELSTATVKRRMSFARAMLGKYL